MLNDISNPIPAAQIVGVNLNWTCLETPTCTTLEMSLQQIVDAICDIKDVDGTCLGAGTFKETMNALIAKACEVDPVIEAPVITYTIDTCTPDTWSCDSANNCITADTTDPEELTQILFNALISTRDQVKALCESVTTLQNQVATLELQLANGCC